MRVTERAARGASQQGSVRDGRPKPRWIGGVRGRVPGIVMAAVALIGLAAAPAASAATTSAAAARPGTTATARPPATTKPPAKQQPAVPSASAQRRLAAAAVRQVLAHSAVPDTCSGPISPDTIYPCSNPSSSGTDTFTFTLADAADVVYVMPVSVSGNELGFTLTAPDASTVNCRQTNSGQYDCATGQTGTYTLAVSNGGTDYTLDFTALVSDGNCTAINPAFNQPPIAGSLAAGQTGTCYTLEVPVGSVLYLTTLTSSGFSTGLDVYDSTGANQNCNLLGANTCSVGGTGPYRIFVYSNGIPETYQLQLYNLTNPQGCVAAPQLAYGQVPDTSSTDPCRTLTVTTAGSYQVVPVYATGGQVTGTVYAADGSVACQFNQYPFCPLAVGSYDFAVAPGQTAAPFGFDFIAGDESSGCTTTGDTGFQAGAATGKFAGVGEASPDAADAEREGRLLLPAAEPRRYAGAERRGDRRDRRTAVRVQRGLQLRQLPAQRHRAVPGASVRRSRAGLLPHPDPAHRLHRGLRDVAAVRLRRKLWRDRDDHPGRQRAVPCHPGRAARHGRDDRLLEHRERGRRGN